LLHRYIVNKLNKLFLSKIKVSKTIKISKKAQPKNRGLMEKRKRRCSYANRIRSQKSPKTTSSKESAKW
jgi:hypothetical protein